MGDPGNIQVQVGWGYEQRDLVEEIPGHCRGLDLIGYEGISVYFFCISLSFQFIRTTAFYSLTCKWCYKGMGTCTKGI